MHFTLYATDAQITPVVQVFALGALCRLCGEFQVGNAKHGALRVIAEAFDLPAVGEDNLLDHRQSQTGALLLRSEVGLEDLGPAVGGNARAIVPHFERGFGGIAPLGNNLDFAAAIDSLDGVQRSEEHTSELQSLR